MPRANPGNERLKRAYLQYLRNARGRSEQTLDKAAAAINRFEVYFGHKDFRRFHIDHAMGFKLLLEAQISKATGQPLSKSTILHIVQVLRDFFHWLAREPGHRSMRASDADYFSLSARDVRIAQTPNPRCVPTIDQVLHVLKCAPERTVVEQRNRALIAFILLTGARDGAVASMKLKHLSVVERSLFHDAREVKSKFSKTFTSSFFPVPDEVYTIVIEWVRTLLKEKLFGPDDPLFPATAVGLVHQKFAAVGLKRSHWKTTTPMRQIFKEAFARAGLPYFNPHSFRTTLGLLGQQLGRTPEEFKVWSQNLGHESPLTTLRSYGKVEPARQAQLMRELASRGFEAPVSTINVSDLMTFIGTQTLNIERNAARRSATDI
jgi:integrase/recombinase XerD